jgi:hypothetical protein
MSFDAFREATKGEREAEDQADDTTEGGGEKEELKQQAKGDKKIAGDNAGDGDK